MHCLAVAGEDGKVQAVVTKRRLDHLLCISSSKGQAKRTTKTRKRSACLSLSPYSLSLPLVDQDMCQMSIQAPPSHFFFFSLQQQIITKNDKNADGTRIATTTNINLRSADLLDNGAC